MIELLKLCGYEINEIDSEIPRITKAFARLGISEKDIECARENLIKYHNTNLLGVRKMLGHYLRELVNLILAREEGKTKIMYAIMAEGFDVIGSAFGSRSKEVFTVWPESLFEVVFGPRFFDKLVPILEAAERTWLKAGVVAHCANVKTLVGLLELNLIPRPDFIVASGFLCDTAPKTIDIMHELYDIPMGYYGICFDREIKENPDAEIKRVTLAAKNMRKVVENIQKAIGLEITDDMIWEQLSARNNLRINMLKLHELLDNSSRLPISATHEGIMFVLPRLAANATNIPGLVDTTTTLLSELQGMVNKGLGVVESFSPRILALVPQSFSDPRLEYLIEKSGMSLVASELDLYWPSGQRTPKIEKPKDPYEALCGFFYDSKSRCLSDRITIIKEACKRLKVDGVLCRSHIGCRTISGDIHVIRDTLTKELGLPCLILEYEGFDPRFYNSEILQRKLELFKMMLDSNKNNYVKKSGS